MKNSALNLTEQRLVGLQEIAVYLNIKPSTIYAWVNQKRLPYIKIGRLVKFDLQDIDAWIQERKVKEFEAS
jgi:excisionase family DNA binding protein